MLYNEVLEKILAYKNALQETANLKRSNEHSYRTQLQNLLNALKEDFIRVIQEPKAEVGQGDIRPDFKVYKQVDSKDALTYNALVGFIECKEWGKKLEKELKSSQIHKYLSICPNILLTDYNRFILINFGEVIADVLLFPYGMDSNLFTHDSNILDVEVVQKFSTLLSDFFHSTHANITTKQELIKVLSTQSFYLGLKTREFYQTTPFSTFHRYFEKTFDGFRDMLYDFSIEEFCDILGQSVVYGLLVAHLESNNHKDTIKLEAISIDSIVALLPKEFQILSEFIYFSIPAFHIPAPIAYALENIKKTIALIDRAAIAKMLNTQIESIAIYLYEDFLKAYDDLRGSEKRKEGGVFYTPESIVNCITSSLHSLLKSEFDKKRGFLEEGVKVLDFATGTGSFLAKVFEIILEEEKSHFWKNDAIKQKFLKDIYGFEISFVPYIVAHIKLSAILKARGFDVLDETNKLQIFLTNTLDLSTQAKLQISMPLFLLEEQEQKAHSIKHTEEVLVILGNPPYYQNSKNNLLEIINLHNLYKLGLKEQNIQPLNNDYIKFIRFAQWKLLERTNPSTLSLFNDSTHYGLMGFITPNSFIWGRTHRKMRESLFNSFDTIYIINLHGDNEKDEKNDENVFDIRIGVCISLFIKHKEKRESQVFYYSTHENAIYKRVEKYALLNKIAQQGLKSIAWNALKCEAPFYWFIPRNLDSTNYKNFWALGEDKALGDTKAIFKIYRSGNKSERDKICLHFNEQHLRDVLQDFMELDTQKIRHKYQLKKDTRDWSIERAKADVIEHKETMESKIQTIAYRPFDVRYTFFSGKSRGFWGTPSAKASKHFMLGENLGLCFTKDYWGYYDAPFVTHLLTDIHYNGGQCYVAPLYDMESQDEKLEKSVNFTDDFLKYSKSKKNLKNKTPEQIFYYIYATLYNPNFREKYAEELQIGFPRINFEVSQKEFETLQDLGEKLVYLHLLKDSPLLETLLKDSSIMLDFRSPTTKQPSYTIEKLNAKERFVDSSIILNEDLCLKEVNHEVYHYTIGGYKVIEKWLSYRNDYTCSRAELEHLEKICKAIEATLKIEKILKNLN
ncbi:type ISP restriction/modification enzyme [Helicobacter sp.]|uniref:type ISP restriction/modification enzyme n=1 Tax=Helicobacter sp. TaxID=218 RepID=UPI0025C5E380|nr:type ISP restriction/modification enzyme [Helicobacter sp.]MCI5968681.1 N-6 DNA methylase [Helicobacter sp.]